MVAGQPFLRNHEGHSGWSIQRLVEARANAGKHIVLVDQFTGFDPGQDLADGVRPNAARYARMANKWYEAISSYLR